MTPIEFPQQNRVIAKDQPPYAPQITFGAPMQAQRLSVDPPATEGLGYAVLVPA